MLLYEGEPRKFTENNQIILFDTRITKLIIRLLNGFALKHINYDNFYMFYNFCEHFNIINVKIL